MSRLIFVRHGQSKANASNIPSDENTKLTELGAKQADKVGRFIKKSYKIKYVYCSPLIRAIQTYKYMGIRKKCKQSALLKERDNGIIAGKSRAMIKKRLKNGSKILSAMSPAKSLYDLDKKRATLFKLTNGETDLKLQIRCNAFINKIAKIKGDILIITHGDWISSYINMMIGVNYMNISNCSITCYNTQSRTFELLNYIL